MKRVKNLCVAISKYQSNGKEKSKWQTVGNLMQDDNGRQFLTLQRTFNPSGVPNPDNKDIIYISMFDIENSNSNTNSNDNPLAGNDKDIPF